MNSLRTFVFVTAVISVITKGQVHNVVLCREYTEQQTIQCGFNQIIDIQSVTLVHMYNYPECSVNLISTIDVLVTWCKRSHKGDGNQVYSRCHGEPSCTVDGSMVDEEVLNYDCGSTSNYYYTNVLWFNYTCHYVDPTSPSVALLPIPENREVRGMDVEIFSPYYPCYIPRSDKEYTLDCRITPHRRYSDSQITYRVRPKYIEILQNTGYCRDWITFDHGSAGGQLARQYCGESGGDKEWWNDDEIISTNRNEFHIKYMTLPNARDGTKFWFIVSVEEHGEAIEVSVTCTGQENIPPLPPGSTCSPFPITTTTTPATTTTSTDPATASESLTLSSGGDDEKQSSNGGLVGGLIAMSVVIVIVVVIAVMLGLKLRNYKREKQQVMQPKNNIPNEAANQQPYDMIPDHLVGTGTGNTNQPPVINTMTTNTTTTYEEIGSTESNHLAEDADIPPHGYVNSAMSDTEDGATAAQPYEDVSNEKQYETLKNSEYENTREVMEPKIYTGLENANRLSKA